MIYHEVRRERPGQKAAKKRLDLLEQELEDAKSEASKYNSLITWGGMRQTTNEEFQARTKELWEKVKNKEL